MRWSTGVFALVLGCEPPFEACEVALETGLSVCVEPGSGFHEDEMDGGSCADAGGVELQGTCEDNDFTCPAGWGDGSYVTSAACPSG